jgi:hypothetical protein
VTPTLLALLSTASQRAVSLIRCTQSSQVLLPPVLVRKERLAGSCNFLKRIIITSCLFFAKHRPLLQCCFQYTLPVYYHYHNNMATPDTQQQQQQPLTIGMQIDTALAYYFDAMSSTQLYALIVGLTIVISVGLLGSNTASSSLSPPTVNTVKHKVQAQQNICAAPEPNWHWFRYFNYAIVALFSWSVAEFWQNVSHYVHELNTMAPFLLVWSAFLCYFFGFFGVSFVYEINNQDEEEDANTDECDKE